MRHSPVLHKVLSWVGIAILASFCASIIFALHKTDKNSGTLPSMVVEHLPESGVENPVTAVLLNFRSYDTLLEIAVLLIVATAIPTALIKNRNATTRGTIVRPPSKIDPVVFNAIKILAPITILVSGYLLWTGAYAPGGAFQAGSMLAAMFIFMSLCGFQWSASEKFKRIALAIGSLFFCVVGALVMLSGRNILEYPSNYAGALILLIEIAATVSIAAVLLILYANIKNSKEG